MKKVMMTAALAALACGCISVHKNDGGDACLKPRVCKDCIHEKYTVADRTVSSKCTVIGICGLFTIGDPEVTHFSDQTSDFISFGSLGRAKNGAYSRACDAAKCDSIVGARYTATKTDYFVWDRTTVEMTGYPAKLAGVEVVPGSCCKKPCPKK